MLHVSSNLGAANADAGGVHSMSQQVCEVGELRFVDESLKALWSVSGFQTVETGFDSRQRLQFEDKKMN